MSGPGLQYIREPWPEAARFDRDDAGDHAIIHSRRTKKKATGTAGVSGLANHTQPMASSQTAARLIMGKKVADFDE